VKNTSRIHKKKYTSIIPHRMFVLGGVCTCTCVCDHGGRSSLPPISIVLVYVLVVLAYMARATPTVVHVHSLVLARCCSHPLGPVCSRLAYVYTRPATDAAAPRPFLPLCCYRLAYMHPPTPLLHRFPLPLLPLRTRVPCLSLAPWFVCARLRPPLFCL